MGDFWSGAFVESDIRNFISCAVVGYCSHFTPDRPALPHVLGGTICFIIVTDRFNFIGHGT